MLSQNLWNKQAEFGLKRVKYGNSKECRVKSMLFFLLGGKDETG